MTYLAICKERCDSCRKGYPFERGKHLIYGSLVNGSSKSMFGEHRICSAPTPEDLVAELSAEITRLRDVIINVAKSISNELDSGKQGGRLTAAAGKSEDSGGTNE